MTIVPSDHTVQLPAEVPEGPVEIIVLVEPHDDAEERAKRAELRRKGMGALAGRFVVPDDFDDPLPPDVQAAFDDPTIFPTES